MFSYRTNRPPFRAANNSQDTSPLGNCATAVERVAQKQTENDDIRRRSSTTGEVLLTFAAVMKRLGVGKSTIWKLIWEGRLEKVKLGRRSLITESSVDRLIGELIAEANRKREAGDE
jgi:excisionase family DNA binding protein